MTVYVAVWAVLALVVAVLAIWRQVVGIHEDDSIHLSDGQAGMIKEQAQVSHKLEAIEKWGKTLTAVVFAYGLVLAGIYLYGQWQATQLMR